MSNYKLHPLSKLNALFDNNSDKAIFEEYASAKFEYGYGNFPVFIDGSSLTCFKCEFEVTK